MRGTYQLVLLLFLTAFQNIAAQEIYQLSLKNVLEKVKENNYTVKLSQKDVNVAKAEYNQSNAVWLPNISVSHTGYTTTNPLMAFGSKLNQEILTQADFNPELLNDPDAISNFSTKIEIQQPIFNADGFYMRKAAKAKMNATELQANRTKKYIELQATKAFMQLQLAYKAVEVLQKAKEAALENKKIAENNFKQGYLQKADVLLVDIHVTEIENKLQSAISSVKNASDYVQFLMGEKPNKIVKPTNNLKATINLEIYNQQFSNNRADIDAMKVSTDAYNSLYKASKTSFLPTLNAFGSYELYDDNLFGTTAKGYLVGAQLTWNVFEGFKRIGKTQKSKAEFDKAKLNLEQYKNKSILEFDKTKRQLKDAENKLHLTNLAVNQAKEALRIRTNRFAEGLEKTSDVLTAETQFLQKQLEYLQTVFNYNLTKSTLIYLTK